MSKAHKGKFEPIEVGSDADRADEATQSAEDAAPRMSSVKHVDHVDKVEMEDAEVSDHDSTSQDSDSDSDKQDNEEADDKDSSDDNEEAPEMSALEVSSRVSGAPDADGKFIPTFDDDATTPSPSAAATQPEAAAAPQAAADASVDQPRFAQSKRSIAHSMSAGKPATGSQESTMEVMEYDDSVIGGKRIEEDQNSKPTKEEADDKQ
jgi:hypothetical protein